VGCIEQIEFDIRGQICPSSLLISLREVNKYKNELRAGTMELLIWTDNRDSLHTIPESVRNMGYIVDTVKESGTYKLIIRKNTG